MVEDVEIFLENLNKPSGSLYRTESLKRIKFRRKIPEEPEFRIPKTLRDKKRSSLPELLNFEEFKVKHNFVRYVTIDENENNEREWTIKILNDWFDEIIPFN